MLQARGLHKRFGRLVAVDDVALSVARGETFGLLGPNGAGKTTTISMLCGLLSADAGEVTLDGARLDPRATGPKRRLGYVPQEVALYPDLTARENLRFFGRLQRMERACLQRRIDEVLEVTGLADRADDRAGEFSGGMQRRLNIGVGLLHEPDLLVLDEPTVGVDPQSRNAILASVDDLSASGLAVLYTTHYMEEAERLCDRIAIMEGGRIIAEGTRRELVDRLGEQGRITLEVAGEAPAVASRVTELEGIHTADVDEQGAVVCLVDHAAARLPALLAAVAAAGAETTGVEVREPDLEDVFLHLTGRALRD